MLARHKDMGLMNQTTRDISPSQLSGKLSPSMLPPNPKFSSTRIHQFSQIVHPTTQTEESPTAKYISPIKVIRRSSQSQKSKSFKCDLCDRTFNSENAFEEHVCAQKENIRTPSPVRKVNQETPHVRTELLRRSLRELSSDPVMVKGSQESDMSISLLAKNKRTKDWVNFTRSDFLMRNCKIRLKTPSTV